MTKSKKTNFIKDYLEEKKKLKEEEIRQKELELEDKKIEYYLKVFLSFLMGMIGTLLLIITAIETKYYMPSIFNYLQVITGVVSFVMIPLIWIVRNEK